MDLAENYFGLELWQKAGLVTCETLFLFFGIYFLIALTYFIKNTLKTNTDTYEAHHCKLTRNLIFALVIIYTLIGIGRFSVVSVALWVTIPQSVAHCDRIEKSYQYIATMGLAVLNAFLWLRQYILYRDHHMQRLVTPCLVRCSRAILALVIVGGVGAIVALGFSGTPDHLAYINDTNTCTYVRERVNPDSYLIFAGYGYAALLQGGILCLFIHILRRHQAELAHFEASRTSRTIHVVIRNCTIAAFVAFISDVVIIILSNTLPTATQQAFLTMWDIDYVINLVCVIFCFGNWKKMLFPWRLKGSNGQNLDSNLATVS